MKTETYHSPSRDARLDEVLADYLQRIERGEVPNQTEWLARYPEHRVELERFFAQERELEAIAAPLRAATSGSAETDELPAQLGDFQILREIGRGGMGIVYEAEQLSIGRHVALKVLPFAALLDPKALQRFKNEVRAVGTLDHPNIVHVHFVGEQRSVYFYAMQLIRGQSLAEVIQGMRSAECGVRSENDPSSNSEFRIPNSELDTNSAFRTPNSELNDTVAAALTTEYSTNPKRYFRRVAELGIQAAEALDHAHQMGIVHRDVKPSNLMLDQDGKLYVTDFGLARVGTDPSMTITGDLVGTLRYMSPEQVDGKSAVLDHRTDVYSLGVTLYELLALRPAFVGESREELLQQITQSPPPPLRKSNPATPAELEVIVHKAIERDAVDRYSSAADLAADLRRFIANEPIRARRPPLAQRTRKWARRHPAVLASAACILLVALLAALAAAGIANHERAQTVAALNEKGESLSRAAASRDLALHAVDDMYAGLATEWIASETAPTEMQLDFLMRANNFYDQIVREVLVTESDRILAAKAYDRIAELHMFVGMAVKAADALRHSIALGEGLLAESPEQLRPRRLLPTRYRRLADALQQVGENASAEEAYRAGLIHLDHLAQADPLSDAILVEQIEYDHGQATLWLRTDQLDRAEGALTKANERIEKLQMLMKNYTLFEAPKRYLNARLLHARGEQATARVEAEKAHAACRRYRVTLARDARGPAQQEIDIVELLGEISEAEGALEQAAAHYRDALDQQVAVFKARLAPVPFITQAYLENEVDYDGQFEHGPFCRYVETQLRLARVLDRLRRRDEAEDVLGEAEAAATVIWAARPNFVLRYHVAQANAWAMAAEFLRQERPAEAEPALAHATMIWQDTLARFPHAPSYRSGVHGQVNDLDWFRKLLPSEASDSLSTARVSEGARMKGPIQIPKGESGQYMRAGREEIARRKVARARAWLLRSMSHALLEEQPEARRWFDKANDLIKSLETPPEALTKLRDDAEKGLSAPKRLESEEASIAASSLAPDVTDSRIGGEERSDNREPVAR